MSGHDSSSKRTDVLRGRGTMVPREEFRKDREFAEWVLRQKKEFFA